MRRSSRSRWRVTRIEAYPRSFMPANGASAVSPTCAQCDATPPSGFRHPMAVPASRRASTRRGETATAAGASGGIKTAHRAPAAVVWSECRRAGFGASRAVVAVAVAGTWFRWRALRG
jgi:hypothetical protein